MKVTVKLNTANINLIEKAISRNLVKNGRRAEDGSSAVGDDAV